MAAITSVSTIARVAELLGEDVDWLWDVCAEMEPEDGCLWVYGPGEDQTIAFTRNGVEYLQELVAYYKAHPHHLKRLHQP